MMLHVYLHTYKDNTHTAQVASGATPNGQVTPRRTSAAKDLHCTELSRATGHGQGKTMGKWWFNGGLMGFNEIFIGSSLW